MGRSTRTWPASPSATGSCGWTPTAWTTRSRSPRCRCRPWGGGSGRSAPTSWPPRPRAATPPCACRSPTTSPSPTRLPDGRSHARDELVAPLVDGLERVLAQDGALRLVVEFEVHPVDGEVAALLLGPADELPAQPGAGGLRRHVLGLEDARLVRDAVDLAVALEQVVQPAGAADVVVGEVHLGDPRMAQRQVPLGAVALDEVELGGPVDLAVDVREVLYTDGLEHPAPQLEHL